MKFGVTAYVFNGNRYFEEVADFPDLLRRDFRSFKRVGHGKQVMRVPPVYTAPTEMIREPRGLGSSYQFFQATEVFAVRGFG